jgi:hypothetical protein
MAGPSTTLLNLLNGGRKWTGKQATSDPSFYSPSDRWGQRANYPQSPRAYYSDNSLAKKQAPKAVQRAMAALGGNVPVPQRRPPNPLPQGADVPIPLQRPPMAAQSLPHPQSFAPPDALPASPVGDVQRGPDMLPPSPVGGVERGPDLAGPPQAAPGGYSGAMIQNSMRPHPAMAPPPPGADPKGPRLQPPPFDSGRFGDDGQSQPPMTPLDWIKMMYGGGGGGGGW